MFMRNLLVLLSAAILTACATTGATFRSGVGDRQVEHPPYYAGSVSQSAVTRVARLPIMYQRGASQFTAFDPSAEPESAIAALLAEMNAFVDSLSGNAPLSVATGAGIVPPNVYFGCDRNGGEDCVERGDSVLGRQGTTMRLAVERPSPRWIARTAALLDSAEASHALVITLEVGQYWTRQSGLRGSKSVELGTGNVTPLPWLTSLEAPVSVLQLTGALVNRDGKATRIGAEGLLAVPSPIVASGFGAQRLFTDDDVQQVRTLRRVDLPGQPLAWRAALCQLLVQLAGPRCV
jgi:hypothetical protein